MKIAFYGDSITAGLPGASYFEHLRVRLPQHTLINYGKINDTPLSLHRRIQRGNLLPAVDLSFVWVGVNDLLIERSWFFAALRRHWARDDDQFRRHYRALLDTLCPRARHIVTVPPLCIGEDLNTPLNLALARRAAIIRALSGEYPHVAYLDLRASLAHELAGRSVLPDLRQNLFQSIRDALLLRSEGFIDRAAARRGLHLTLDGVHLNSSGARLAADAFARIIEAFDQNGRRHEQAGTP